MKRSAVVMSFALFCLCIWLDQRHTQVAAEKIECIYLWSQWHDSIDSFYYCQVLNAHIFNTGESVHIDGVSGEHLTGRGNEQVLGIEIRYAPGMGKLPTGLAMVFPNLIGIHVYDCKLKEITSEDLRPFPQLKYLLLQFNQLTRLNENLFEHNKHLEILNFNFNKIAHVHPRAVSGLSELEYLEFYQNPCNPSVEPMKETVEDIVRRIEQGYCQSDALTTASD